MVSAQYRVLGLNCGHSMSRLRGLDEPDVITSFATKNCEFSSIIDTTTNFLDDYTAGYEPDTIMPRDPKNQSEVWHFHPNDRAEDTLTWMRERSDYLRKVKKIFDEESSAFWKTTFGKYTGFDVEKTLYSKYEELDESEFEYLNGRVPDLEGNMVDLKEAFGELQRTGCLDEDFHIPDISYLDEFMTKLDDGAEYFEYTKYQVEPGFPTPKSRAKARRALDMMNRRFKEIQCQGKGCEVCIPLI